MEIILIKSCLLDEIYMLLLLCHLNEIFSFTPNVIKLYMSVIYNCL